MNFHLYAPCYTDKQIEVQLSFPPYSEDQEIIDGRQVHPSSGDAPPYSTHQLSSHTLNVPHPGMKPPAPVFVGTTPQEEQRSTQQHYQRPQWLSMCTTVPGSRPPTHVAAIGPNTHLQSAATHYTAHLQVGGTSHYQPLTGKHCLKGFLLFSNQTLHYSSCSEPACRWSFSHSRSSFSTLSNKHRQYYYYR